jgi:serine protease Do/serine protease DegQ
VEWKAAQPNERGVVLAKVLPNTPAHKAGLKAGDRLLKFGDLDVTDDTSLRSQVLEASSPVEFTIERAGEAEPLKIQVELNGTPVRLGIAWRDDPAEPGSVMLTQVIYGSAAHRAGLRERDRIYEIGGQSFSTSAEFQKLATSLPSPLEILAERAGRLTRHSLDLPAR